VGEWRWSDGELEVEWWESGGGVMGKLLNFADWRVKTESKSEGKFGEGVCVGRWSRIDLSICGP